MYTYFFRQHALLKILFELLKMQAQETLDIRIIITRSSFSLLHSTQLSHRWFRKVK